MTTGISRREAVEGRPYSKEHNEIPEPDQSEYVNVGRNNLHSFTKEPEEEEETKEEKEIEEQEPEMEAEEERRIEDPIETEEADESPTFDIMHCKRTEYERQAISLDPVNFIEVLIEEIRQHKRNRARTAGAPQKNQTDGERDHNRRNKDQRTERLIKLRELGRGDQPETRSEQLPWYCSATKWITEEYLNTHQRRR
jgi:hypothetical protein